MNEPRITRQDLNVIVALLAGALAGAVLTGSLVAATYDARVRAAAAANEQRIAQLGETVAACQRAAQVAARDDTFAAQLPYTILYEPDDGKATISPGLQVLDAWKPGLGRAIARLQHAQLQNSLRAKWVLYRQPPEEFFRVVLQPAGGHVVSSFSLPQPQ
jgi:hypothetical protein